MTLSADEYRSSPSRIFDGYTCGMPGEEQEQVRAILKYMSKKKNFTAGGERMHFLAWAVRELIESRAVYAKGSPFKRWLREWASKMRPSWYVMPQDWGPPGNDSYERAIAETVADLVRILYPEELEDWLPKEAWTR